jgi:hypothetical protein
VTERTNIPASLVGMIIKSEAGGSLLSSQEYHIPRPNEGRP